MNYNFTEIKKQFEEIVQSLREDYKQISTGRANPSMLDSIMVDSYGTKQPIKGIASINIEDARTLRVVPWDKSQIGAIETAIRDSGLPFSTSSDDGGVRASVPQLTSESKEGLVKLIKEKLELVRIRIRDKRHDTVKDIEEKEKSGEFAEDDRKRFKDELQKIVDDINKEVEELFENKEKDIMKV